MNICIDRTCPQQVNGPHYTPTDVLATNDPLVDNELELLKQVRGRVCYQCKRYLIYTDEDHTYCNDCWDMLMAHTYISREDEFDPLDPCDQCGEEYDSRIHNPSKVVGRCANCGGYISEGEGNETVHYTCWDAFATSLNEVFT